MLRPIRTVAPSLTLLDLDAVKAHLRVDHSDDDELIEAYMAAAEAHLDGYSGILGRCLINQTWEIKLGCWPVRRIALPFADVSSVTVTYRDADNASQTLLASKYRLLEGSAGSIIEYDDTFDSPSLYDRGDAITVSMVCGYGATVDKVPAAIHLAAKMLVGHFYQHPEATTASVTETPLGVAAMLAPYRRVGL